MLLMVDNFDSFTFNIVRYFRELASEVQVVRNDVSLAHLIAQQPKYLVISPGPGSPAQAGVSCQAVEYFAGRIPVLGICLGHQVINEVFGGRTRRARQVMHGKNSLISHDGQGVFAGLDNPFSATRYHSLLADETCLPDCLQISAWTNTAAGEQDEIMGLQHRSYALAGVQFHPEAVLTSQGHLLLANFLRFNQTTAQVTPQER